MRTNKVETKSVERLFQAISETLNEIGYMRTMHLLRKGQNNVWESDIQIATEAVCKVFNITPDVIFGNQRKYPRKYAFAIWVYTSFHKLNYSLPDLTNYSHKSLSTIFKSKQWLERLVSLNDVESAFDRKILGKLEECIVIINNAKSE